MNGRFLYFLPGLTGLDAGGLRRAGLLDRFAMRCGGAELIEHGVTPCDLGPGGQTGVIVAAGGAPPRVEDGQAWVEIADRGSRMADSNQQSAISNPQCRIEQLPPGPADLERPIGIGGYETTLGDGQSWRVPVIWRFDAGTMNLAPNVPTALVPAAGGIETRVAREYQAVAELGQWVWQTFCAERPAPLEKLFAAAVDVLAVNYRIGIEEAGLLGLLDEDAVVRVLGLAIDAPGLRRAAAAAAATGLVVARASSPCPET